MSTKSKKPTGKVAQTITAVKNIAKRLTAGKTVTVKKEPVKKTANEKKPKPASKPSKPAPKKTPSVKPNISKPAKAVAKPAESVPVTTSAPVKKTTSAKPAPFKSPTFCVQSLEDQKFIPAKEAKAISIPGFDGIQLFIHKGANDYRVSEASSGGLVAVGHRQKVAVEMATDIMSKHGKPKIIEKIQESINRFGVAPGFTPPTGITVPDKPAGDGPKEVFKVTTDDGTEIDVTYTPGFMKHLEFRGEISSTGYHSSFDYAGKIDVKEAARKKANELRVAFLKEQARQARKTKKEAAEQAPTASPAASPEPKQPAKAPKQTAEASGESAAGSGNRGGKSKGKMSLLDAAAEILKSSNEPLCCKDITRLVFEKKLAESGGLTPHATLSAAMGREISTRGKDSRFKRADRGLFAFNS